MTGVQNIESRNRERDMDIPNELANKARLRKTWNWWETSL
jgi:hypothetical protein